MNNHIKSSRYFRAIAILLFLAATALVPGKSTADENISFPGNFLRRVLPDNQPDRYWILAHDIGLIKVEKINNQWLSQEFPVTGIRSISGPDSSNHIYCSFSGNPAGVHIFDCTSESIIDTINLNYYTRGTALSPDETKLYVAAWESPTTEEDEFDRNLGGPTIPPELLDRGLLLEIDLLTKSVLRSVHVGSWPDQIYYAELQGSDKILVSTQQCIKYIRTTSNQSGKAGRYYLLDIIDVNTFSIAEPRLEMPSSGTFTSWPDNPSLVAFTLTHSQNAIKLLDPSDGSITATIPVEYQGYLVGAWRIFPDAISPDEIYVCINEMLILVEDPYNWVIVIDKNQHQVIRSYNLGPVEIRAQDVYETLCGDLIVIANDREFGYVKIFERENPPVCILDLVTPMPHIGDGIVEFDATASSDPDPCDTLTYEWDFDADGIFGEPVDDAYTGPDDNPTHTYAQTYIGPVLLRLTDSDNLFSMGVVNVCVIIE